MRKPALLTDKKRFLEQAIVRLGRCELDYAVSAATDPTGTSEQILNAGVLLLLSYQPTVQGPEGAGGEFFVHLIKRSATVSQAGDLSCPGGILNPHMDKLWSLFLPLLLPVIPGAVKTEMKRRDRETRVTINTYLANALRETWEEVHLPPWRVRFLGALPTYGLLLMKRRIFPMVALLKDEWNPRANSEVERIVNIPLNAFFQPDNYAWFEFLLPAHLPKGGDMPHEFPCLVHHEPDGRQEILWGATFNIIMNFLGIVSDFRLPAIDPARIVRRSLPANYLHGRNRS